MLQLQFSCSSVAVQLSPVATRCGSAVPTESSAGAGTSHANHERRIQELRRPQQISRYGHAGRDIPHASCEMTTGADIPTKSQAMGTGAERFHKKYMQGDAPPARRARALRHPEDITRSEHGGRDTPNKYMRRIAAEKNEHGSQDIPHKSHEMATGAGTSQRNYKK